MADDVKTVKCPCCGAAMKAGELSKDTVDHYLTCIISGVPFWKTYEFYNGKVVVTVKCVESDSLMRLQMALNKIDSIHTMTDAIRRALQFILHRLNMIKSISLQTQQGKRMYDIQKSLDKTLSQIDKLTEERADMLNLNSGDAIADYFCKQLSVAANFSAVPNQILDKAITEHMHLYQLLVKQGQDENFWKGIKQA